MDRTNTWKLIDVHMSNVYHSPQSPDYSLKHATNNDWSQWIDTNIPLMNKVNISISSKDPTKGQINILSMLPTMSDRKAMTRVSLYGEHFNLINSGSSFFFNTKYLYWT